MAFSKEIYAELEAAVGAENVSQEPCVLETYRCATHQSSCHYGPYVSRTPMPQAVVLPETTEEVQKVVKICNKYGIKFKASTTFWSAHGYIGDDYSLQMDMRRMNKFSIDPKNMIMTIEPNILAADAQAEAMHYGLTCNIPGCGCSSSIIASTSGWAGGGPSTIYTGGASDNLLSAEFVLPSGEIAVIGSGDFEDSWFSEEGPGPSQRAIFRGGLGAKGEMGVCTKMSIKLAPWPGPQVMKTVGPPPAYRADLPENISAYAICFPNWDMWAKALLMLCDAEIVFAGHRQFSMFGRDLKAAMLEIITDPDRELCDLPALMSDPKVKETNDSLKIEIYIIMAGMSPADTEWKEKALDEILRQCGGWKDKRGLEPDMADYYKTYFIRLGHKNLNYTMCGSYEGHFGLVQSNLVYSASICEEAFAIKKEWEQKGTFMAAVGGDTSMGAIGTMGGGGGPMLWEFFCHFDGHDYDSVRGCQEYFDNVSNKWQLEHGLDVDFCNTAEIFRKSTGYYYTPEEHDKMFVNNPNPLPFIYQFKMRDAFNPNRLNGSYYATLDPEYMKENRTV